MAGPILLFPTEQQKAKEEQRVAAERWAAALSAALALPADRMLRMKTAPEIRDLAQQIGPIAGRFGIDSSVTARAVAALVTICHPVILACMLATAPMEGEVVTPRRKRGRR